MSNPIDAVTTTEVENVEVINKDLKTFDDFVARFSAECISAGSVPNSEVSEADLNRQLSYVEAADKMLDKFQAMPEQDKPYTHPFATYKLDPIKLSEDIPNEHFNLLFREWQSIRLGLRVSQSRYKANKLHPADYTRWKNDLTVIKTHLTDIVPITQALDLPDTGGAGQSANVVIPSPLNQE